MATDCSQLECFLNRAVVHKSLFFHIVHFNMSKRRLLARKLPNPMSQAIDSEQWDKVISLARSKPELAKKWSERTGFFEGIRPACVLPLHEACAHDSVPVQVIQALIPAYPESIHKSESAYQRLAIHIACRKTAKIDVVHYLLQEYADGSIEPDVLGRLPVHYALSNGANEAVVNLLLDYRPNAAAGVDRRGWTPLHVACSMGASTSIITRLLQLFPQASVMITSKGTSVFDCMDSHCAPNKAQVLDMLRKCQEQVETDMQRKSVQIQVDGDKSRTDNTYHSIV